MLDLASIVDECIKPEKHEDYAKECKLEANQVQAIDHFIVFFGKDIVGLTIDGVRFISDGVYLINSFAIIQTNQWKVFKHLFKTLGDNWALDIVSGDATQLETFGFDSEIVTSAIEKWSEDDAELQYLATTECYAIYKNQQNKAVFVDKHCIKFIEGLNFYLNDVEEPTAPMTLTHGDSSGFAGLLMPCSIPDELEVMKANLKEAIKLLEQLPCEEAQRDMSKTPRTQPSASTGGVSTANFNPNEEMLPSCDHD